MIPALFEPGHRRRWTLAAAAALLVHMAPSAFALRLADDPPPVYEDVGVQMLAEIAAEPVEAEAAPTEEAAAEETEAAPPTPEVTKVLSEQSDDDLPETDASPHRPDDPDLLLAEKKTLERSETASEQQSTEEMQAQEAAPSAAASAAAPPPSVEESAAPVAAAPAEGSVREAPPTPASWTRAVMAHLGRHKRYPRAARSSRAEGDVVVAITIGRDGRILTRTLRRSSGHAVLDAEALALVARAAPLPAMPANMLMEQTELVVPIRYRLKS